MEPPLITGSLSPNLDLRSAVDVKANTNPKVFFQGQTPGHTKGFVLTPTEAADLVRKDPGSREVLFPYIVGQELLHAGVPSRWVIDIDADDAIAKGIAPAAYERVRTLVLPDRQIRAASEAAGNTKALARDPKAKVNWHHRNFLNRWWQHSYRREDFLQAIAPLDRFIALAATSSILRKPVFTYVAASIRPSHAVQCLAFDDDYSFGVLHSSLHDQWFRGRCSHLKSDLRYTSATVFNSFPWPQTPSPKAVEGIVSVVEQLIAFRHERLDRGISLAHQYDSLRVPGKNQLRDLHTELDRAVMVTYDIDSTVDPLTALLAMNQLLAAQEQNGETVRGPGAHHLAGARRTNYAVTAEHL